MAKKDFGTNESKLHGVIIEHRDTPEERAFNTREFKPEAAYRKGWLDHQGKYDGASRLAAAQEIAKIFKKAQIGQGRVDFDRVVSGKHISGGSLADYQLVAFDLINKVAQTMSRDNYRIIHMVTCYGYNLSECLPPMYKDVYGAPLLRLCEALDDLYDALTDAGVRL